MTSSGSSNLEGANATTKTPDIHQSITTMASTTFTGKLITPANYGEKYLYEVNFSGGVIRTGTSPRILEGYTKFILDYVSDPHGTEPGTDLWDLTLTYKNSPPHPITVEIWQDGVKKKGDVPRVMDGM